MTCSHKTSRNAYFEEIEILVWLERVDFKLSFDTKITLILLILPEIWPFKYGVIDRFQGYAIMRNKALKFSFQAFSSHDLLPKMHDLKVENVKICGIFD